MDLYRLILKSAADGFFNHRGEEFTLRELNEKYNPQSAQKSDKKK